MKPEYMTKSEIRRSLNNVPRSSHLGIALCKLPSIQVHGIDKWDRNQAIDALLAYYRKQTAKSKEQYRTSTRSLTSCLKERVERWARYETDILEILQKEEERNESD